MIKFRGDTIDWIDYFGDVFNGMGSEIYRVYHKGKLLYPSPDDLELNYHLRVERSFTYKVKRHSEPNENPKIYDEIETGVETIDIRAAAPIYVATAGQYINNQVYDTHSDNAYADLKIYNQLLVSLSYIGRGLMDSPRWEYYDRETNKDAFANNRSYDFVHAHEKDTAILTYNVNTNLRNYIKNFIYCPAMLDYVNGTRQPDWVHELYGNKDYINDDERFDGYSNVSELYTSDAMPSMQLEQTFYTGLNDLRSPIEGTYLSSLGYHDSGRPFIPIAYTGNFMIYYYRYGRLYTFDEEESNFLVIENNNPSFGSYSAWANSLK